MGGADGAASARVADECSRVLGRGSLPEAGEQDADLVKVAKLKGLDAWEKSDVSEPRTDESFSNQIARTRRVLTSKMADGPGRPGLSAKGVKSVKAGLSRRRGVEARLSRRQGAIVGHECQGRQGAKDGQGQERQGATVGQGIPGP